MDETANYLQPVKLPNDLKQVADLVELCFAETLDEDGRTFIQKMRQSALSPGYLGVSSRLSPPLTGFVWRQDGRMVGNLSMIPIVAENQNSYLIANVAVHPDYRGRGIATQLTEAGLGLLRKKRVRTAWLQVREDNPAAIHLYQSYQFKEEARRTVWHSPSPPTQTKPSPGYQIHPRRRADWQKQQASLKQLYPDKVRWNLSLDLTMLAPGLLGGIWRSLNQPEMQQWSLRHEGKWVGSLSWQSSQRQADWLWLAAPPEHRAAAITHLLPHAARERGRRRTLALNYPAGKQTTALEQAGFHPHQTLIWMKAEIE